MTERTTPSEQAQPADLSTQEATIIRFDIGQRISHLVMLFSFTILGFTGLIQKFIDSPISLFIMNMLGGIERTRFIHRGAAIALMIVSIYHILDVLYRI